MNYIDPSSSAPQLIVVNTKLSASEIALANISWSMQKDGNDDISITFTTPSDNFNIEDNSYFQTLTADFFSEGVSIDAEHHYLITGAFNNKLVYSGKVFTTDQQIESYTVNKDQYTQKTSTNNFTILD